MAAFDDWAWVGYYPPCFEYVAMKRQNEDESISRTNDPFWNAMLPFICGPHLRQESLLLRWLRDCTVLCMNE